MGAGWASWEPIARLPMGGLSDQVVPEPFGKARVLGNERGYRVALPDGVRRRFRNRKVGGTPRVVLQRVRKRLGIKGLRAGRF
jgi:hypothetical protein